MTLIIFNIYLGLKYDIGDLLVAALLALALECSSAFAPAFLADLVNAKRITDKRLKRMKEVWKEAEIS